MADEEVPSRHAPIHHLPDSGVTVIEHPCVIQNITRSFKSLGDEENVNKVCFTFEYRVIINPADISLVPE